jgi:hypothetical protein
MSKRLDEIRRRREYLVARAEIQRSELGYLSQGVDKPLRLLDKAMDIVNIFRLHPALMAITASFFIVTPRHRLLLWMGRALTGWELYQVVREQLQKR